MTDHQSVDAGTMKAAAAVSAASYGSFAEATRSVLDLLEGHLPPETAISLAHLDRAQDRHRIIDERNGYDFGLHANATIPLGWSLDLAMAEDRAPRLVGDVGASPIYSEVPHQRRLKAASYLGVPLELSDGSRVAVLSALSRRRHAFDAEHLQLLAMLARMLAYELERESNERDLRRLNESMRVQARGMAAASRVVRALATEPDARPAVCEAACEASGAQVAFLLEPRGSELCSTAMHGIVMAPVTIQARNEDGRGKRGGARVDARRAFADQTPLFVRNATEHEALAPGLVQATDARSALFEPVTRDGALSGMLILIWQERLESLSEAVRTAVRLVAAEAAVAIEHAGLRRRVDSLALTDDLTGLPTKRIWDQELPRELARARRNESPVCIALVNVDRMTEFNERYGNQQGDQLVRGATAGWMGQLREVDLLARLDDGEFGVLLPACILGEACDVLDRLRAATPRGQTASAGVARWDGEEHAEVLVSRCAGALAAAKAAGGDMTLPAD